MNELPMEQWTPEEVAAHVRYMRDFANRLQGTGEFVEHQALSPLVAPLTAVCESTN